MRKIMKTKHITLSKDKYMSMNEGCIISVTYIFADTQFLSISWIMSFIILPQWFSRNGL